jgi:hypothetical protein
MNHFLHDICRQESSGLCLVSSLALVSLPDQVPRAGRGGHGSELDSRDQFLGAEREKDLIRPSWLERGEGSEC